MARSAEVLLRKHAPTPATILSFFRLFVLCSDAWCVGGVTPQPLLPEASQQGAAAAGRSGPQGSRLQESSGCIFPGILVRLQGAWNSGPCDAVIVEVQWLQQSGIEEQLCVVWRMVGGLGFV